MECGHCQESERNRKMSKQYVLLALFAAHSLAAQSTYSPAQEKALGDRMASDFRRDTPIVTNAKLQGVLDEIGRRLATQFPNARLPFTFEIMADDPCSSIHEPMSFPAGHIFVPLALFSAAENESEFAGVLAHAMAHTVADHVSSQVSRRDELLPKNIPIVLVGGWIGGCSDRTPVAKAAIPKQRSYELQADQLGANAMALAGYAPSALANYLTRVQPERVPFTVPGLYERLLALIQPSKGTERVDQSGNKEWTEIRQEANALLPAKPKNPPSLLR